MAGDTGCVSWSFLKKDGLDAFLEESVVEGLTGQACGDEGEQGSAEQECAPYECLLYSLFGTSVGCQPAEQKEVMAAQRATVRLKEPGEGSFNRIPMAHTPVVDGPAVWAAC